MEITLFAPGLLLPDAICDDVLFDLEAPTLSLVLGRGDRFVESTTTSLTWLAQTFSTAYPLPVAALRRAAEAPAGEWLCLDPVHWRVEREGIYLDDPLRLDLSGEEAAALCAAVAPIFAPWGALSVSAPGQWELCLSRPLMLETRPLPEACGQDPGLPGGAHAAQWRSLLSEAQIVLHAHPVNREREAAGKPRVNSLWPWGAGKLPSWADSDFTVCWSQDPVVAGLCHLADLPCITPPERFEPASGRVLCHVERLIAPARRGDALAWRLALLSIEQDWLAPILSAIRKGRCSALRILATGAANVPGAGAALYVCLEPGHLLRFWRRPVPLSALTLSP